MRIHSDNKIQEVKRLRHLGHSINEIVAELIIPKTTVWHHVQGMRIDPKHIKILNAKRGGSHKRFQMRWAGAKELAEKLMATSHREKIIAGVMLYWGEGSKKTCEFINSDGQMIQDYLIFLRKALNIAEKDIRPTVRFFSGMSRVKCLDYWSHITNIPIRRFKVGFNDGGTRGKTPHGLCRITVMRGADTLKLIHSLKDIIHKELFIE